MIGWLSWGMGALMAARMGGAFFGLGGGLSATETSMVLQVMMLLAKFGYVGILLVMTGAGVLTTLVRRRVPSVVWWLLLTLLMMWLWYLYIVPFKETYRIEQLRRARLSKDWTQDCEEKTHASLQFHAHCINVEIDLDQNDAWVAFVKATDKVQDRLWTVASWTMGAGVLLLLFFGVATHLFVRAEQLTYLQRKSDT